MSDQVRQRALSLFLERGYAGTSLRDIAADVGVTPAAVYYHYRSKGALLADLLDPMLDRLDQLAADLEKERLVPPHTVLSRLLDALLADREAFRLASNDIAIQNHPVIGAHIAALNDRFTRLLSSTERSTDRVLVNAALGVLLRPLARYPDEPLGQLRNELIDGALCVLGQAAKGKADPASS